MKCRIFIVKIFVFDGFKNTWGYPGFMSELNPLMPGGNKKVKHT